MGGVGAQVGRRLGVLLWIEGTPIPFCAPQSGPHPWGWGTQYETRTVKRSLLAWPGLKRLRYWGPSFSSFVHFCSFSSPPLYPQSYTVHTALPHHRGPPAKLSPCSVLQTRSPRPPAIPLQHFPRKTSALSHAQREGCRPPRPVPSMPRAGGHGKVSPPRPHCQMQIGVVHLRLLLQISEVCSISAEESADS